MKKFGTNFNLVLISQIISLFGGNILRFALMLFIVDLTESAGILGIVAAISQVPVILFAPIGGLIADRMNKKRLVVALDFAKTVICFVLLFIFLSESYSTSGLTIFMTVFMAIVTLFQPILTAAVPMIVKEDVLVEANGAIQSINALSDLLGTVLGGILFATIGVYNIVLFSGFFFLASTLIDLFIKIPFEKQERTTGILKTMRVDMKESSDYMSKGNPALLKSAIIFSILSLLFIPILSVALPYIVRINFGAGDELTGISQAVAAVGMLLGGGVAGKLKSWLTMPHLSKWILAMGGLCFVLALSVYMPLFPSSYLVPFWIFNMGFMLIMLVVTLANITVFTLIQEQTPMHLLGKVIALVGMIANLATPVGNLLFGFIIESLGNSMFILFIGIAVITVIVAIGTKKTFQPSLDESEKLSTPIMNQDV